MSENFTKVGNDWQFLRAVKLNIKFAIISCAVVIFDYY
jgi:hypothetical protein